MPLVVAETPAAYAERPRLVVGACVVAPVLFDGDVAETVLCWMRSRRLCALLAIAKFGAAALRELRDG